MKRSSLKLPKYDPYREEIARIAADHRLSTEEMLSPNRSPALVEIRRQVVIRLLAMGLSRSEIGGLLGRDHTSIMNMLGELDKRGRYKNTKKRRKDHEKPE